MEEKKAEKSLIIVSVPFTRNARNFISSKIYESMKSKYDVLIVSPLADQYNFQQEFGGPNVSFMCFKKDASQLRPVVRKLYSLSEKLRRYGYYFRFRHKGLQNYWTLVKEGYFEPLVSNNRVLKHRLLSFILGFLGYFGMVWKLIDIIFVNYFYNTRSILKYTHSYQKVILIQTASWGYQERFLAGCALKYGYKSIFVPFTTDQILIGGYLINCFDKICPQGPIEEEFAVKYHGYSPKKILRLGMLWLRNIDSIFSAKILNPQRKTESQKVILYAGLSSTYFPRASEFIAIDNILRAIREGILPKSRLIYRPVCTNDNELIEIENRYKSNDLVELQYPSFSIIGVSQFLTANIKQDVIEYLNGIYSIDLLIMSKLTSMFLDAAYFKIPCIANYADGDVSPQKQSLLRSRVSDGDVCEVFCLGMPKVFTFSELLQTIKEVLSSPEKPIQAGERILLRWDYKNSNYINDFMNSLEVLTGG